MVAHAALLEPTSLCHDHQTLPSRISMISATTCGQCRMANFRFAALGKGSDISTTADSRSVNSYVAGLWRRRWRSVAGGARRGADQLCLRPHEV